VLKIIDRDDGFHNLACRQQFCTVGAAEQSTVNRRRHLSTADQRHDVRGKRLGDLPIGIPQDHLVEPFDPRPVVDHPVCRLMKEENLVAADGVGRERQRQRFRCPRQRVAFHANHPVTTEKQAHAHRPVAAALGCQRRPDPVQVDDESEILGRVAEAGQMTFQQKKVSLWRPSQGLQQFEHRRPASEHGAFQQAFVVLRARV
jgi:hypothetical protein